tara:strand:+ start:695 stop:946 length:252 start_codon:yes stop_codon:yes gene_type:complete
MCICINCKWVERCQAYHAVERQHGVNHLTNTPDLEPKEPRIHISVMDMQNGETEIEWDVRGCESFLEDQGRWVRLRPGEEVPR